MALRRRLRKKDSIKLDELDDADDQTFETDMSTSGGSECLGSTYWFTRVIFLRCLGFVYFVAFLIAFNQNRPLIGQKGILPAKSFLRMYESRQASFWVRLYNCPTLLWFASSDNFDFCLDLIAVVGMTVSIIVFILGAANALLVALLWVLYHSLVSVGQTWYSFGWESQLLETGFLAIFFCPIYTISKFPPHSPPSIVVIAGYRWLIFRIMLGAGLIKVRGDSCWRDLTCMNYHYQTQPVPNPLSYFLHQAPEIIHKFETMGNHIIELVIPFLLFYPRKSRIFAGHVQIVFQIILILSGNLSFLNWLTILPSICCFDDKYFTPLFSPESKNFLQRIIHLKKLERGKPKSSSLTSKARSFIFISLFCILAYLSVPVVLNMLSPGQAMNRSFNPLRIVNTYGAFGSVTKSRTEVIIQGTYDDPISDDAKWLEYEFYCKPGNVTRRPCVISPYHYRLDWLMWFAPFRNAESNAWFIQMISKLLQNDKLVMGLIEKNPFDGADPPKYIRAESYEYTYTKIGGRAALAGEWWNRERIGSYLQPVNLKMLAGYLTSRGFDVPSL